MTFERERERDRLVVYTLSLCLELARAFHKLGYDAESLMADALYNDLSDRTGVVL